MNCALSEHADLPLPHVTFRADKEITTIIPHAECPDNKWFHVELFSGGFGGWKQASEAMKRVDIPWHGSLAVEVDHDMGVIYCNSCGIKCTVDEADPILLAPFPVLESDHELNVLFRGDVADMKWMLLVPWSHKAVVTISAPCPPWSSPSDKDGLNHSDGMLFVRALLMMRFLQPKGIAIKNVASICQHEHFSVLVGLLKWCGFQINWQKESDLKCVAPTTRKRWLAVCTPVCDAVPTVHSFDLVALPWLSLSSYRALIELPEEHERALTLDHTLKGIYGNCNFAGSFGTVQKKRVRTGTEVLHLRCKKPCDTIGTVMAMYGEQHKLSPHVLARKGLFTELFDGRFGPRFFSPMELAIIHGISQQFVVPLKGHAGHKAVGNCISVPQALQALAVLRRLIDADCKSHPIEIVTRCMQLRLHAGNAVVRIEKGCLWIIHKDQVNVNLYKVGESVNLDTPIDVDSGNELEIPATIPFSVKVQVSVDGLLGRHVLHVDVGVPLNRALNTANLQFAPDMTVVANDGTILKHDAEIDQSLSIQIGYMDPHVKRLLDRGSTWMMVKAGTPFAALMKSLPATTRATAFRCFDLGGQILRDGWVAASRQLILVMPDFPSEVPTWKCHIPHGQSVQAVTNCVKSCIPECFISASQICIRAFELSARQKCLYHFNDVHASIHEKLAALDWYWEPVDDTLLLGTFRPGKHDSAPVDAVKFLIMQAVAKGIFEGFSMKLHAHAKTVVRYQGAFLWEGALPECLKMDYLMGVFNMMFQQLGFGNTRWTTDGVNLDASFMVCHLPRVARLVVIDACAAGALRLQGGGAAKVEVWKECKTMLGKEMIARGWPLASLDDVATQWLRAIGTNKVFSILKQQLSPDQRWTSLADSAKWAGLPVLPEDPVRLRAVRAIQKAVRKNSTVKLDEKDYQISRGFFVDEGGDDVQVLATLDLSKTGVYLATWDEAHQWITKDLPVVPDALGLLTLYRDDMPQVTATPTPVTFPAVDGQGRRVLLKGMLWQLGESKVMAALKDQKVAMPETIVLACTIWKDECTQEQWEQATRNLVKIALSYFDEAEPSKRILQVWGRSFRDTRSRVEPSAALSGQFHMRIYASSAESFLKLSGKCCAYLTPKDEQHLSHPGWGLIWMSDKAETGIAASKATEHSGLARSRDKFALRVRSAVLEAIAVEVKPDNRMPTFPIAHLFKVQPIPVEVSQAQIIEWANNMGWRVKVLKRLGQHAYLLGAGSRPPHENMSMNGSLILVKEVVSGKKEQKQSALVAGPKPPPCAKAKTNADQKHQMLASDPWAAYIANQGQPAAAASAQAATPQPPKAIEGPIQAKFAALKQRMQSYEKDLSKLNDTTNQVVQAVQHTNNRLGGVEKHVHDMQHQMASAIEQAMSKGMKEQEKKLDSQFASIMQALHGQKRDNAELDDDEDHFMESPLKPPPAKK
eukprot:Skav235899  [mRNA]  locus=scaffold256:84276:88577:+ [translate_table: standard]